MRPKPTRTRAAAATSLATTFALTLAFGLGLSALTGPARAEEDVPLDTKLFRGLMQSLGLERGDKGEGINYQERPPLVIPPDQDLPRPVKDSAVNNPAWPKDPDVTRRKLEAKQERERPHGSDEVLRDSRALRPDQLTPGANDPNVVAEARRRSAETRGAQSDGDSLLSPSELGFKRSKLFKGMFSGKDNEAVRFTGEPPRTSLAEPPAGYQTPSPDQPYGAGRGPAPKATDYYTTHGEQKSGH